jgi:hypothetical protein
LVGAEAGQEQAGREAIFTMVSTTLLDDQGPAVAEG